MIKTDPSQTKAVVVLLLILGAAVVWTVIRVTPGAQQQQQSAASTTEAAEASSASATIVPAFQPSRNPFRKPASARSVMGRDARLGVDSGAAIVQEGGARQSGNFKIGPMPIGVVPSAGANQATSDSAQTGSAPKAAEPEKPQFALVAIVGGDGGFTAVIRCGESNTRVVGVGDVLEGGYRVEKLEESRAVLRDGRDVVVIKRPNS